MMTHVDGTSTNLPSVDQNRFTYFTYYSLLIITYYLFSMCVSHCCLSLIQKRFPLATFARAAPPPPLPLPFLLLPMGWGVKCSLNYDPFPLSSRLWVQNKSRNHVPWLGGGQGCVQGWGCQPGLLMIAGEMGGGGGGGGKLTIVLQTTS